MSFFSRLIGHEHFHTSIFPKRLKPQALERSKALFKFNKMEKKEIDRREVLQKNVLFLFM